MGALSPKSRLEAGLQHGDATLEITRRAHLDIPRRCDQVPDT
jgi:hypothetical protein